MSSDRELSAFLHRACHDLRTPVRAVRAHAELLIKQRTGEIDQPLSFIIDGARKADLIVDAISAYAGALEIDPATFQPTRSDVMLRAALARLATAIRESHTEVTYGEMPRVRVHPDRLSQIFELLIRNAIEHSGPAPSVHIDAAEQGGMWMFAVSDQGQGVVAGEIERIFHPFEKLNGKGAGMGLAIGRAIVEAHGGKIWAENGEQGGLTVRFTLPA
jgi:signal transduction histidine kinase